MVKIYFLHTVKQTLNRLKALTDAVIPNAEVDHVVDVFIGDEMARTNAVNDSVARRVEKHMVAAEADGFQIFVSACSSIGNLVYAKRRETSLKLLRIDEAMMEEAAKIGGHVLIVGTVVTTVKPSLDLFTEMVVKCHSKCGVSTLVISNEKTFNGFSGVDQLAKMSTVVEGAGRHSDVIVLAQASMEPLAKALSNMSKVPVLCSPESGIQRLRQIVDSF